ncbi:MAG: hypothetical protein LBF22_12280 [Deltaproteobacteria bacterium]|nr:hypothetical protein [Deltaproteobacteria bacterium]
MSLFTSVSADASSASNATRSGLNTNIFNRLRGKKGLVNITIWSSRPSISTFLSGPTCGTGG